MKIVFDNQTFCLQAYGGISRYIVRLAECLQNDCMGNEVKIFAGFHQNHYLPTLSNSLYMGKKISYPTRGVAKITSLNSKLLHPFIHQWNPDIIHQTYYFDLYHYKKPVVITVHDMIHELYQQDFLPNDITTIYKRKSVQQAEHIIAISQSTKKDLMEIFNIAEHKISVVYHGVDYFNENKIETPIYHQPYLLYVGQRAGYKNFEGLVRAYAHSRLKEDFDLVAFGGGKFTVNEMQLFQSLGIQPSKIKQFGGDDSVLANLYHYAHAFIYPSKYEGFGIPPLEAMAQGCPVVSSHSSSMPEVIGSAGEYFNPNDIDSMIESILKVVYDDERKQQLIQLGYERVNLFSWQKCAKETQSVYEKLL